MMFGYAKELISLSIGLKTTHNMKEKIIFTNGLIDLAQPRLGTKVIYKTDDFFAPANRIISPTIPVFK